MISAQLKKYKLPQYKAPSNSRHNFLNGFYSSKYPSYQTSKHHSEQSSHYPSPKSKIALLNEKILKETELFNQRREKSINHIIVRSQSTSRRRLRNEFHPTNPYIARFTDGEQRIRKKNALTKQRLASAEKQRFGNMKKSLPPKSPLVLSQYIKNSTRSYEQQNARKSTSNSYAKRGLQQIVFVTDQSQEEINSQDDYQSINKNSPLHPTWRKGSDDYKQPLPKNQLFQEFNKYQNNFKDSHYLSIPGAQTPNFTSNISNISNSSQKQIMSPIQLQQQMITSKYSPPIIFQQPFLPKINIAKEMIRKSDKKAIYTAIFIITMIAILLFQKSQND